MACSVMIRLISHLNQRKDKQGVHRKNRFLTTVSNEEVSKTDHSRLATEMNRFIGVHDTPAVSRGWIKQIFPFSFSTAMITSQNHGKNKTRESSDPRGNRGGGGRGRGSEGGKTSLYF